MRNKKNELKKELLKIADTGKSYLIKRYNLSLKDMQVLLDILCKRYNTFIENNVANLLKDYGYNIKNEGIGYKLDI